MNTFRMHAVQIAATLVLSSALGAAFLIALDFATRSVVA